MKTIAWVILVLTLIMFLAMIYYLVVGEVLFKMFFSRKNIQKKIVKRQMDKDQTKEGFNLEWWDKQKFQNVFTKSEDKLKLAGHYLSQSSDKTAILVHGFGGYLQMQPYANFFLEKGFNVLVVENRGCGNSEGKAVGFVRNDARDILCWIRYLNKKNPNNKILLFGLSYGGSAVCYATGEDLPKNVLCAISDSAFENAQRQIKYLIKTFKPSIKIFEKHLFNFAQRVYELNSKDLDVSEKIRCSKIPILLIHGQSDKFVLTENAEKLFECAPQNQKEILIVSDAGHCESYAFHKERYEKKMSEFLKQRTNF